MAMRFPAKITSSCIWVALPVDLVIYIGMPVVQTNGWLLGRTVGGWVYGDVITKFSDMGRFT